MSTKANILLVENDKESIPLINASLTKNGYRVICASSGKEGLSLAASHCPDVVLMSLDLLDMDSYQVLIQLRDWSHAPVIVISAPTPEENRVRALDMGADDFITKPFGLDELMARIRTALRRSNTSSLSGIYKSLQLEIDFKKRIICLNSQIIHLTQTEYLILALLAKNSGHVLTYDYIINSIWGPHADSNNQILRVNMANIRKKIEPNPAQPQYVFTVAGMGYRMRENEEI